MGADILNLTDQQIDNLPDDPALLKDIIKQLTRAFNDRIQVLENRIEELESQLAKDSHNSSKPPSSDGYKKPKNANKRKKSNRKPGGQKGHKGNTLQKVDNPDHTIPHKIEKCSCCGHPLINCEIEGYDTRQVFDIPPVLVEVTEHKAEVKYCEKCGCKNTASFPPKASAEACYGSRIKSLLVYLTNYQLIPYERATEILQDLFHHNISVGSIYSANEKCYINLADVEQAIKKGIIASDVAHFDETGLRVVQEERSLLWLHSASTDKLTHYALHAKRGKVGMEAIGILPRFRGRAIHDHWKSYFHFPCYHALCNAHHGRELTFVFEEDKLDWAGKMIDLLLSIKKAVDEAKAQGKTSLNLDTLVNYQFAYEKIIREALELYPEPEKKSKKRGRKKQSKSKNLLDRLNDFKNETLAFMYDFKVPFDNNLVERDLRMAKLKIKISGCFRSRKGADMFCRIRGYISTMKKQKQNVMQALMNTFTGNPLIPSYSNQPP
jgi:transposase